MTMICRISDERINNPWDDNDATREDSPSIHNTTISELMGQDFNVWLGKNKEFGFVLELENDDGDVIVEKCIHPCAAESLASFCRRYLNVYEKIEAA